LRVENFAGRVALAIFDLLAMGNPSGLQDAPGMPGR
jgi:hypothetical protein